MHPSDQVKSPRPRSPDTSLPPSPSSPASLASLWGTLAHSSGARLYALVAQFGVLAISTRWLGPEGRGAFVAVVTWMNLFANFGHLSMGQVAMHRAATSQSTSWLAPTFGSLLAATAALTTVGAVTATVLYSASGGALFDPIPFPLLACGGLLLPFLFWEQYASSLLIATDRLRTYNWGQILGRSAGLVGIVLLVVVLDLGVVGALVAAAVAQAITSLFGIRGLWRSARPTFDLSTLSGLARDGVKLHANVLGPFLLTGIDILMITYYLGASQAAFYQLAAQLLMVLMILPFGGAQVSYSRVTRLGADAAWPAQLRLLAILLPAMAALAALAALLAPWGIRVVAGDDFGPAVPVFRLLVVSVVAMTFTNLMASQWIGRGFFKRASGLTLLVGGLNIVGNRLLIPVYGIEGAVWATLGSYLLSVIGNTIFVVWLVRRSKSLPPEAPVS